MKLNTETAEKLRGLFHEGNKTQLEEQLKNYSQFMAEWVIHSTEFFNEKGGTFEITDMPLKDNVIYLTAENEKGEEGETNLMISKWMH
ncbi:MAG: hypothetical protein ABI855_18535 [Bacteroidota bacterium]